MYRSIFQIELSTPCYLAEFLFQSSRSVEDRVNKSSSDQIPEQL